MFLAVLLSGCAGDGQKGDTEVQGSGKEKLVIWSYYETEEQQASLDRLVEMFNTSQGVYEASWEYHGPVMEFGKQISLALTEKQMPDLVIVEQSDMQNYIYKDLLEDITSYVSASGEADQYYQAAMQSVSREGRYYGLPFCCNTVALFYNKEPFQEAGLEAPETMEEFLLTARALSYEGHYGFAMSAVTGAQGSFQILPWLLSLGDELEALGGEGTKKAFSAILELIQSEAMPRECMNWSPNDVARGFLAGQYAMMENTLDVLPLLEQAGMDAGIVKLPLGSGRKSVAGGENIGIIKGKNRNGAMALLEFYSQEDVMEAVCGPQFGLAPKKALARRQAREHPKFKVFEEELEDSISRSSYFKWPGTSETLSQTLIQVILEKQTPEQAAKALAP